MLGSAVFRTGVAPGGALAGPWVRNSLWTAARAVPSLDLRFAENKSLVDATTGQNLVTFTRASSGTYVDSQGVIRTATTNLLLQSEDFSTTWGLSTATVSTNVDTAPNGSLTADKLIVNSGASNGYAAQANSYTSGTTYAFSVYVKAAGATDFRIVILATSFGFSSTAQFNLSNGTVTSFGGAWSSAAISAVGNGWYRVSCIATATATASSASRFQCNATGDGSIGVLIWGAQLEQSSTVGEYIPTTSTINSAPRFDHSPTTGESLGLLVEESRTNFVTQSETFAGWSITGLTQTTASVTNPTGNTGSQLFTEDTATSTHRLFLAPTTGQTVQSFTIWVKIASGSRLFYIESDNASGTRRNLRFNLQTGAVDNNPGDWSNVFITQHPGGWFRLGGTITDNGGSTLFIVGSSNGASASYAGDGASGFYLWGAQLEAGAFPTSYIPTTTATVTRSADVASISGSNFSGWYRQDEGSFYSVTETLPGVTATNRFILEVNTGIGAASDKWDIRRTGSTAVRTVARIGGVSTADRTESLTSSVFRAAAGADGSSVSLAVNGGTITPAANTVGTMPVVTQMQIGNGGDALMLLLNGTVRRLTYWPTRLPNETLQTITQ